MHNTLLNASRGYCTKFKKEKRTISAVAILCTQVAFSCMLKANFLAPLNSQFCKLGLRDEDVPTQSQKVMAEQERRAHSESMKFCNTLNSHTQKKKKKKRKKDKLALACRATAAIGVLPVVRYLRQPLTISVTTES